MAKATAADWAKRVERWKDSGLSAKEFAAELGVSPNTLTFWKWKLTRSMHHAPATRTGKQTRSTAPTDAASFVQLVPTERAATGTPFEITLANGVTVRVPVNFDEGALTRLVRSVGGGR